MLPENELIIIDEIQKIPALLDEVHWLMTNNNLRFILSGSSARKLKRSGVNLSGGRANSLLKRNSLLPGSPEFGHALEHLIIQEVIAYLGYSNSELSLSYWRTTTGYEVDAIIGNAHTKGLKAFSEEFPDARLIIVSLDKQPRRMNGIDILPAQDFLRMLWNGFLRTFC